MTDFKKLRDANVTRNVEWLDGKEPLDLAFRGVELAGEVGEACNIIKKLARISRGIRGSMAHVDDLKRELADVVICVDLIAMDLNIDLGDAVAEKFNETSEKYGLSTRIAR